MILMAFDVASCNHSNRSLSVQEVAESVKQDFGSIDILVHSLANGPEVKTKLTSLQS